MTMTNKEKRQALKVAYPGTKFRVSNSKSGICWIEWSGGPTKEQIRQALPTNDFYVIRKEN